MKMLLKYIVCLLVVSIVCFDLIRQPRDCRPQFYSRVGWGRVWVPIDSVYFTLRAGDYTTYNDTCWIYLKTVTKRWGERDERLC